MGHTCSFLRTSMSCSQCKSTKANCKLLTSNGISSILPIGKKGLPSAVPKPPQAGKGGNDLEVLCQVQQLRVSLACEMSTLERANDQPILFVEDIIAPQVIKHDGVVLCVDSRVLGPEHRQRLAVKLPACRIVTDVQP